MRILIIGSTSFIGPAVIGRLLDKGHKIKCLVRTGTDAGKVENLKKIARLDNKEIDISFSTGNLQSSDSILSSLRDMDAAVYLTDLKHGQLLKNFLDASARTGLKRAVFISSTTVLITLDIPVKKLKIASEDMIKKSSLDYTILRPTMIYGSKDDGNYSRMVDFIKSKGFFVIFGNGKNLIQPIFIGDVANAVAQVLENQATWGKTYELCGKKPMEYREMLKIVRKNLGKSFKIIKLPFRLSKIVVSLYSRVFPGSSLKPDMVEGMQIDKAYSYLSAIKDFGFNPVSFEEGIKKLINELQK